MVPRQTKSRLSYLVATGTVLAELAEGPLNGIALLIGGPVEGGRPSAPAAAPQPVPGLVRGLGHESLDLAAAQVRPDRGAGVRLIGQHLPGPGPGAPRAPAARPAAGP